MKHGFLRKFLPDQYKTNVTDLEGKDEVPLINKEKITEAVIEGVKTGAEENDISPSSDSEQVVDIKDN